MVLMAAALLSGCAALAHLGGPSPELLKAQAADRLAYAQNQYGYNPTVRNGVCQSGARLPDLNDLATNSECDHQRFGDAIVNRSMMKGMTKSDVYVAWGPSCDICPGTRNNRWGDVQEYNRSSYGDIRRANFVYFNASGRVSGWNSGALP